MKVKLDGRSIIVTVSESALRRLLREIETSGVACELHRNDRDGCLIVRGEPEPEGTVRRAYDSPYVEGSQSRTRLGRGRKR